MNALAFGPSLVDISASLNPEQFKDCLDEFKIEPGGWSRIDSDDQLEILEEIVFAGQQPNDYLEGRFENVNIHAGSSVLGMLAAFAPQKRAESRLITARAVDHNGEADRMSQFFVSEVGKMAINYDGIDARGINPLGFVLSSKDNPEKILLNYPGVTTEIDTYDIGSEGNIVILDSYELQGGKLGTYIDQLIRSGNHKVALSLGNQTILQGTLAQKIRTYIQEGKIFALFGNEDEYKMLYPSEGILLDREGFPGHTTAKNIPFCMVTHGPLGLTASWDGRVIYTPAAYIPYQEIVNTSGAGDTAGGAFIYGILSGCSAEQALARAALLATETLKTTSSLTVAKS